MIEMAAVEKAWPAPVSLGADYQLLLAKAPRVRKLIAVAEVGQGGHYRVSEAARSIVPHGEVHTCARSVTASFGTVH